MNTWRQRLQRLGLGLRPQRPSPIDALDSETRQKLASLADARGSSEEELVAEMVRFGLTHFRCDRAALECWQSLSTREQEVTALACLGYANKQIGFRLRISSETVKTYMRHILTKFNLPTRAALAARLAGWDFSAWEDPPPER